MQADTVVDIYIDNPGGQEPDTLAAWRVQCLAFPDPFAEGIHYGMP